MKILVIGDVCEDVYVYGTTERKNPEASATLLRQTHTRRSPGMAANVAENLRAFCDVTVHFPSEPYSKKTRFYAEDGVTQLMRVDQDTQSQPYKVNTPEFYSKFDAIVVSDYNKGFITQDNLLALINAYRGPIFVDTKKTHLKPLSGPIFKINGVEHDKLKSEPDDMIVTCGAGGCWYKGENFPAPKVDVVDVCGAGDTFLAALAYHYTKDSDMPSALSAANLYAAQACTHPGVYAVKKT
jgi:D-beta-D-heptose 7-phosphate kinase/D-beta-D-heptose 1-phosphate adenosyltransferase